MDHISVASADTWQVPGWPPGRRIRLERWLMVVASAVSGIATFTGLNELTGGGAIRTLYALVFTLLVQGTILWAVERIATTRGIRRLAWVPLYAVAVAISVGFGYGFFYGLLSAAQRGNESRAELRAEVARRLTRFAELYHIFAETVDAAAAWSAGQAEIERSRGGTCGGKALPGAGPRTRLRLREARVLREFARHFVARADRIGRAAAELDAVLADRTRPVGQLTGEVNRLYAQATALAEDARIAELRRFAETRIAGGREGFVDPRTGQRFTCPDPELERRLNDVLALEVKPPDTKLPPLFTGDRAASLRHALATVGALMLPRTAGEKFDPALDVPPLFAALAVDLLLLMLGLADRTRRLDHFPYDEGPRVFDPETCTALERLAHDGEGRALELLATYTVPWRPRQPLLFVPLTGDAETAMLRRLAFCLEERGMLRFLGERSASRLGRRLGRLHRALLGDADRVLVYRWVPDAWTHYWLDRMRTGEPTVVWRAPPMLGRRVGSAS